MGLLESIGRSGAVGQFGQNMLNNALQYGQFSQQSQESQMRQKIMDQKLAEQERMNRPVLLSELIGKGTEKGRPNFMKVFADAAKLAGAKRIMLPDGSEDYTLAQADLPAVQKFMEMQKDMHPQLQWATYQDNLQMILDLQKQREKAKTPVEQMQIDEQIEAMKAENAGILTEFGKGNGEKGFTLSPGQKRFDAEGKVIASVEKGPEDTKLDPFTQWYNAFNQANGRAPNSQEIEGYRRSGATNITVDTGLSKGARTKAEEEVQEGTDLYTGLENIISITKPDYLTYKGKGQAFLEKIGEKAELVNKPEFLKQYSDWKTAVEQEFNKYRKWVTGVAAGPVELEMIRKTFPTTDMSYTEFISAARKTAITSWKLVERRRRALAAGIMDTKKQKDFYRLLPLDQVGEPPAEVLQRFDVEEPKGILTAEDYIKKINGEK